MSFPAYPSYKDSGVEWLNELPSHWSIVRIKTVLKERDERSEHGDEELLSVSAYTGVSPRSQIIEDGDHLSRAETLVGYKRCFPNDLVMNIMLAWNRGLGVSRYTGIVSPAYCVFVLSSKVQPRFIDYLSRSNEYTAYFKAFSSGVIDSRLRLYPDTFGALYCGLPPMDEQAAIAAFLDRETAQIDALIEEQRRLIALLREKRQAVISHAVTRGLDPHAPMKDSGTAWLREVPAHWSLVKIKHICSHVVDCLHTTPTYDGDLFYPAIRTADVERGRLLLEQARLVSQEVYEQRVERLRPIADDILYSREGERFGIAALVPAGVDLCLGQRMMMFRTRSTTSAAYIMWALNSDAVLQQVLSGLGGATSPHINIGDIINFLVPEPPLAEQEAIAQHIEREVSSLDNLARTAAAGIALLQERRAALISAAVTGKIDVREPATVLTFPMDRARARGLVAIEIIERSAHQATFGRVKLQKIAFLTEAHVGVSELAGSYTREAAGPLDRAMIAEMESGARSIAGVSVNQAGGTGTTVNYRPGPQRGAHRQELDDWLGADRTARFDKLITDFAGLSTRGAEAVATLYGVWNDALMRGLSATDEEIISGFLNDWHPEKRDKFRADELPEWLGWMRRHGIVPTGSGPKTTTGRLFA